MDPALEELNIELEELIEQAKVFPRKNQPSESQQDFDARTEAEKFYKDVFGLNIRLLILDYYQAHRTYHPAIHAYLQLQYKNPELSEQELVARLRQEFKLL